MENQTNKFPSSLEVREGIENKKQTEAWESDLLNYRDGFIHGILAIRNAMLDTVKQTKYDVVRVIEEANIKWIDKILDDDEKIDNLMIS